MNKPQKKPEELWSERLQAGERIRLFGSGDFYALLVFATVTVGIIALVWRGVIQYSSYGRMDKLPFSDAAAKVLFSSFVAAWVFICLRYIWGNLVFGAIRFAEPHFDFWDWRGRLRRVEFANILALTCQYADRTVSKWKMWVCYFVPGYAERTRWLNLESEIGWRRGLNQAVKAEIVRRSGLTELRSLEEARLGKDSVWISSNLHSLLLRRYKVPLHSRYLPLVLGGLLVALVGLGLAAVRFGWIASAAPPAGMNLRLLSVGLVGVVVVAAWIKKLTAAPPRELAAVEWNDREVTLFPRRGNPLALAWPSIIDAVLPVYPGRGWADIYVSDDEPAYRLAVSENPNCLAFLDLLRHRADPERASSG